MTIFLAILIGFLGIVLFVWALSYHFSHDELDAPPPTPHVGHHTLNELAHNAEIVPDTKPKITPSTTQLNVSPMIVGHPLKHVPVTLSGMGSSWKPLRKIVSKRIRFKIRQG